MIVSLEEKNNNVLHWISLHHPEFHTYFKRMIKEENINYSIKKAQQIINLTKEIGYDRKDLI